MPVRELILRYVDKSPRHLRRRKGPGALKEEKRTNFFFLPREVQFSFEL